MSNFYCVVDLTARLTEIDAELDLLDTEEEQLGEMPDLDGDPIIRRTDARPEIILAN